jgi:type IV pilus assembly protein PilC
MLIPFAGPVLRYISIVHLSRTLGTLLSGGVPLVEALELAGRSTPNGAIEEAVKGVIRSVEQGEPLSDSLQKTALFPSSMIWMLSIGEKRGKLDGYLLHNAEMYQERLEGSLRTTEIVVAPLAILILGIFVFFTVIALFLPLIQLGMLIGGS